MSPVVARIAGIARLPHVRLAPSADHAGRATSNHKKPVVVHLWMFLQNFPDAKESIEPERAGFSASALGNRVPVSRARGFYEIWTEP